MSVIDILSERKKSAFSFEVLPPLKGNSIERVFSTIDSLKEFDPQYINITTHRSEVVYKNLPDGLFQEVQQRHRPGTVAIAAAIQHKYNIPTVPHILCSGFTRAETEYVLIDLAFLGITDLLLLRGDKGKHERAFTPSVNGHAHASDLQEQVNRFNEGYFADGSKFEYGNSNFCYGVAGYPEKHDEAPNMDFDIECLKQKVANGASYVVTQMFFDNQKYFDFTARCRQEGITVPIIPGLKPVTLKNQLTALPKIFHVDIPEAFAIELRKCKTDADAVEAGIEWCAYQAKELMEAGVPSIHFYTMMATQSVRQIAERIY